MSASWRIWCKIGKRLLFFVARFLWKLYYCSICIVLYYRRGHYTTVYYIKLQNTTLHNTTLHHTTPHKTTLHNTIQQCTELQCTTLHYTALYNTLQYSAITGVQKPICGVGSGYPPDLYMQVVILFENYYWTTIMGGTIMDGTIMGGTFVGGTIWCIKSRSCVWVHPGNPQVFAGHCILYYRIQCSAILCYMILN